MIKVAEALPLSIFLVYIRMIDTSVELNWKGPFITSGMAALFAIVFPLCRRIVLSRIFLGINLYLISGAAAFIFHHWWVNTLYGRLEASGMLMWVAVTGIGSILLSKKGFTGVDSSDDRSIKKYSCGLVFIALVTSLVSLGFQGNPVLSQIVPFGTLFLMEHHFISKLKAGSKRV